MISEHDLEQVRNAIQRWKEQGKIHVAPPAPKRWYEREWAQSNVAKGLTTHGHPRQHPWTSLAGLTAAQKEEYIRELKRQCMRRLRASRKQE